MNKELERLSKRAQLDANRNQVELAILNLNRVGAALYVIRSYDPRMESQGKGYVISRFLPDPNFKED